MYKMVRKGNTSLQYTIIPQTDQLSSSSFPQSRKSSSRVIKYTMATLMILIVLSCIATPFLISQNDQNLFTSSVLAMGHKARNATTSQIKVANINKSKNETSIETKTKGDAKGEAITPIIENLKGDEGKVSESVTTDSTTQRLQTTPELLKATLETSSVSQKSSVPTSTTETLTSPTSRASELPSRSDKSPLKLMENVTIPEQYEEAGISDYDNGNASVLAPGVSVEELMFKTSEGTTKPRTEKRFFRDFRWQIQKDDVFMPVAAFACFVSASVMMFLYVRRWCAMWRQTADEPEIDGHEEDKSTLLESLTETEDIE